jgi:N-acetyl-beta-hexosaminidase
LFLEFITVCWKDEKPYQAIYSIQAESEIFNPTIDELYPFVKNILTEFKDVFVDDYIHLGNDEVYYECCWCYNLI